MPTRYREQLTEQAAGKLVLTIDTEDKCLLLYPLPDWEVIEQKVESLPSFNATARRVQRLLIGHATEANLDSQGRILVPGPLRDYAGLDKHVVLVGQGKKFEIWDDGQWHADREVWLSKPLEEAIIPPDLETLSL